jgi:hypothetical protein
VPGAQTPRLSADNIGKDECLRIAKAYDHVIITPPRRRSGTTARSPKPSRPATRHHHRFRRRPRGGAAERDPQGLPAIDWVGRKEFDFTCKEVAEGRPLKEVAGSPTATRKARSATTRTRTDPQHGCASVGGGRLQAGSADREVLHRLPASSVRQPLHRPRVPGPVHFLPLAPDHRRPQVPRPLARRTSPTKWPT